MDQIELVNENPRQRTLSERGDDRRVAQWDLRMHSTSRETARTLKGGKPVKVKMLRKTRKEPPWRDREYSCVDWTRPVLI